MNIEFTENIFFELEKYLLNEDYLLVTDSNVFSIYKNDLISRGLDISHTLILTPGEASKSMKSLMVIYEKLLELKITRQGKIISLGGGVVGDISGLAAATYKRGITYIQIGTTLLSQVDSSVGGKTGINFNGYKNIVGAFYFPKKTYIDSIFIDSLNEREILSGIGEIVKYGMIYDYSLFRKIDENIEKILGKDKCILDKIIRKSINIKREIVDKDKRETGLRKILNLGHTIGHSIESKSNYALSHGEAVLKGIYYESIISYRRGLISKDYMDEIKNLISKLTKLEKYNEFEFSELLDYMKNDKKNEGENIVFVLPVGKGKVEIFKDVSIQEIKNSLLGGEI